MKLIFAIFLLYIFRAQASATGCNCVVFRLDDIQDYWLSNNQQTLIDTFRNKSLPLTLGVIANYFGQDGTLVQTISNGLNDPKFPLEIADHGFNHEDFTTFTYEEQLALLQNATAKIKTVLPTVTINSFIPPYNTWNNDTLEALSAINIKYMSSQVSYYNGPYVFSGETLYHFPEGARTDVDGENMIYAIGVSADTTMAQVRAQIAQYGYSVIMMHTTDFSVYANGVYADDAALNSTQYSELLRLIDMVQANFTLTTLNQIPAVAAALSATTTGTTPVTSTTGTTTDTPTTSSGTAPTDPTTTQSAMTSTTGTAIDPPTISTGSTPTTPATTVQSTTTSDPSATSSSKVDPAGTTSSSTATESKVSTDDIPAGSTTGESNLAKENSVNSASSLQVSMALVVMVASMFF